MNTVTVKTSFATYTPESIENSDADERGWENEEGETFTDDPDEDDGPAIRAAGYIHREGGCTPSQSPVNPESTHLWWSTELFTTDYSTGEQKELAFHLSGDPDTIRQVHIELCRLNNQRTR